MTYKTFQDVQDNPRVRDDMKVALALGDTQVWYSRENVGNLTLTAAERFDVDNPKATHVRIAQVAGNELEWLYVVLQGEHWSPNGEANNFLHSVGATHTSLSCGDVLVIDGVAYVCMPSGWKGLKMPS